MPGFWHPNASKPGAGQNDQADTVKKCRQILNNLEIKIVALENKIHYNFFSIEDVLKELQILKDNKLLQTHAVLNATAELITKVIKKIFHATPSQAEQALNLISKAVEAMDSYVYRYYFDGKEDPFNLEKIQLLISDWLVVVSGNKSYSK